MAGKGSNSITDFRNSKKGKKGKSSAQEDLGIVETPAEQVKNKQIPNWSESEKNHNLNRIIRDGDAQAFYGIPEEAIRKMYDPATADIIVKTIKDQQKIRDSWLDFSDTPTETASKFETQSAKQTKPETQYAEQAVKEQVNSKKPSEDAASEDAWAEALKSKTPAEEYKDPNATKYASPEFKRKPLEEQWDEVLNDAAPKSDSAKPNTASQPAVNSEKVTPEKQAAKQMVENAKAPAEQAKSEKPSEGATADAWFADMLSADKLAADKTALEKQKALEKQETQDVQAALERQAAQDMVDNSKPAKKNEQPAWVRTPWRETMYRLGDNTPEINPPEKYESSSNSLWDFPELAMSRNSSFYLNDAYARKLKRDEMKRASQMDLDIPRLDGFGRSPARYNSLSSIYGRNEPLIHSLAAAGVLGLGGLGLYGRYKYGDTEQPQTQVPNQIEPEPANEAVAQSELTPEQQFVLQSTSPFDYAKGANLFDLYDRHASPDSIDNFINDEEPIDEAVDESVLPQNPPAVGTNIKDANLVIPDADETPEEINDAMLDAKPGSFWKAARGAVASRANAAKNAAQNVFGRILAHSKTAPKASNGSASNIQDTSNGPVVLNDPDHRKIKDVQNNSITPEQAAASQMVNQFAGIPVEVVRAKNSGYAQPPLNHATDVIWDRVRKAGLSSPEQAIRSGLFTPAEVRYITENDLWRYR